jgi:hypothetical protein
VAGAVRSAAIWTPPPGGKRGGPLVKKHRSEKPAAPLNRVLKSTFRARTAPWGIQRIGCGSEFSPQQPDGDGAGDTPGVAAAPVALAGAIVPGVAKFIVTLSAHADVFGVGTTVIVGSMPVPASSVAAG